MIIILNRTIDGVLYDVLFLYLFPLQSAFFHAQRGNKLNVKGNVL